jgi:xanthine dehydrogenase iron-sulfur cluster and FAD-binding subunit A
MTMWDTYYAPDTLDEALVLRARYGEDCRIIAGGTDLLLELERGVRRQKVLVDITRVPGLDAIEAVRDELRLGPLVTHNRALASPEVTRLAFPLAQACGLVGAAQIRNRGTVSGNLITASPANDTITPLWAMDAAVTLASRERGARTVGFDEFFQGVRHTALAADEILAQITVPQLRATERGVFLKFGLRQAQAISVANAAVVVEYTTPVVAANRQPGQPCIVKRARIALGAVGPTILRAAEAEDYLAGERLTDDVIARAAELAARAARPISDLRGSAGYRRHLAQVLVTRGLTQLRDGTERDGFPRQPAMLWGKSDGRFPAAPHGGEFHAARPQPIRLTLNGRPVALEGAHGKTLLAALRENAGLTGTKEGCAEGECGACTVWLDGIAVLACLVPAERADGCTVVTVEGLAGSLPGDLAGVGERLHPAQDAFMQEGAVQCGYCTPGMLMATASLLDEIAHPTEEQVRQALAGNLCRCTGYYTIMQAVERADASGPR